MKTKLPKDDERYSWTSHVFGKMMQYGISESRIKRIIRYPARIEEGIASNTVAAMQPAGNKRYQEIWVMYKLAKRRVNSKSQAPNSKQLKIITTWRYPGKSPERDPIPAEVIEEVRKLL
jgi:hypothetical protein